MVPIYIGMGSNINRHRNLLGGLLALSEQFGELHISQLYESASLGFTGKPFFNLVVGCHSSLQLVELSEKLAAIEYHFRPIFAARPPYLSA